MKNVLLITSSYPITNDGREAAGSFVKDIALELSEAHKVYVVAPGIDNTKEQVSHNLLIIRYKTSGKALSQLISKPSISNLYEIFSVIVAGRKITLEACDSYDFSHVIAFWALPCGWWAKSASTRYNVPFSIWALGSDIWSLGRIPVVRNILKQTLSSADNLYADGTLLAQNVNEITGKDTCKFLPSVRVHAVHNYKERKITKNVSLAFVGRWHKNKGIDILLDSLIALPKENWNIIDNVTIAGGGPLESLVLDKMKILRSMGRKISVDGYLTKNETHNLFSISDYVLIPSRIESIPLVLTDAIAAGAQVIAMPTGDLKLLIEKYELGYVATSISVDSYTAAISKALMIKNTNRYLREDFLSVFNKNRVIEELNQLL